MAITLVTSPPAHPNQNSYISLSDADSYITTYGRVASSDSWNDLNDEKKKFALLLAAKALDTFSFRGSKVVDNQPLAFPRYTWRQINEEGYKPYQDFFWATQTASMTKIITAGELKILNNKIYDTTSSQDIFFSPKYNGYIDDNMVVKQVGLSCDTYVTLKFIDPDGEYVTVRESIDDEAAPSAGVDIYSTSLYGYQEEVGQAQAEIALQVVNENIFQVDLNKMPEPQANYVELANTMVVRYKDRLWGQSKFSKDRSNSLDIIYMLLGSWISAIGGVVV